MPACVTPCSRGCPSLCLSPLLLLLAGASLAAAIEDPPQCVAMGNVIPEGEKGRGSVETVGDMDMYPPNIFLLTLSETVADRIMSPGEQVRRRLRRALHHPRL